MKERRKEALYGLRWTLEIKIEGANSRWECFCHCKTLSFGFCRIGISWWICGSRRPTPSTGSPHPRVSPVSSLTRLSHNPAALCFQLLPRRRSGAYSDPNQELQYSGRPIFPKWMLNIKKYIYTQEAYEVGCSPCYFGPNLGQTFFGPKNVFFYFFGHISSTNKVFSIIF